MFFSGQHFSHLQQEMMSRQHASAYMQQLQQQQQQQVTSPTQHAAAAAYFSEQQRYQFSVAPQTQAGFPQQGKYLPGLDSLCQQQRPQGHTSTIRALKRKLQENFISSCKPTKLPRMGSADSDESGYSDFGSAAGDKYMMNVNVFNMMRGSNGVAQVIDNGGVRGYGETMPMVYQQVRTDAVHALRHKKAFIGDVGAVAQMLPIRAPIVQKLPPTCSLEQVVPEVSIPDCYLTPDPSPASSPKPLISRTGVKQETQEIKQLTSYVMGRLDELKQNQTISETPSVKSDGKKRKNLPVIDATFVDTFFDEIDPFGKPTQKLVEVKTEPRSPEPIAVCSRPSPVVMTSQTPPPLVLASDIKEELTLSDCTDLEEFLGLVGEAGPEMPTALSPASVTDTMSPVASPTSSLGTGCQTGMLSPKMTSTSFYADPCIKSEQHIEYVEMSPGSCSPGYEGRDELLDADDWLLEPISLPLEMSLEGLAPLPDVHADSTDDLCRLKHMLQGAWEPCGTYIVLFYTLPISLTRKHGSQMGFYVCNCNKETGVFKPTCLHI